MFQKLFSCFSDNTENRHIDLSKNSQSLPQSAHYKPQLHPESNVKDQNINFDLDESQNNTLSQYFKQPQRSNNDEEPIQVITIRLA